MLVSDTWKGITEVQSQKWKIFLIICTKTSYIATASSMSEAFTLSEWIAIGNPLDTILLGDKCCSTDLLLVFMTFTNLLWMCNDQWWPAKFTSKVKVHLLTWLLWSKLKYVSLYFPQVIQVLLFFHKALLVLSTSVSLRYRIFASPRTDIRLSLCSVMDRFRLQF